MTTVAAIVLLASAARSSSGSGVPVALGTANAARLVLTTESIAGTVPTLDVTIETSPNALAWRTLGTFAQVTASGWSELGLAGAEAYVRAKWAIAGAGATFTFSVQGLSIFTYAAFRDLKSCGVTQGTIDAAIADGIDLAELLELADGKIDQYMPPSVVTPLTAPVPAGLRRSASIVAAYDLLVARGFNPAGRPDEQIERRYRMELEALMAIRDGKTIIDTTPGVPSNQGPAVLSDDLRGYLWRRS